MLQGQRVVDSSKSLNHVVTLSAVLGTIQQVRHHANIAMAPLKILICGGECAGTLLAF